MISSKSVDARRILYAFLTLIFVYMSYTIWNGYLIHPSLRFFSTVTEIPFNPFQDEGEYIENNTSYKFYYWVTFSAKSVDGFLAGNPFHLKIYGFVEYVDDVPEKDVINTTLMFKEIPISPYTNERIIKLILPAKRKDPNSNRFFFKWEGDLMYVSSGPKQVVPTVWISKNSGIPLKSMVFIDVAPPYITTELKLMRATVILTIWIIFYTIVRDFILKRNNCRDQ